MELCATYDEVKEAANKSTVFEISEDNKKLRKRKRILNQKYQLLGLDE